MSLILFFRSAMVGRELLRFCRAVVRSDGSVTLGGLICWGLKVEEGDLVGSVHNCLDSAVDLAHIVLDGRLEAAERARQELIDL